ncbi:hypothetical protein GUITHDRAFT_100489 [Guillardia theta CCMP2712]|uniref:SAM-dependent MTase RsmB/NOP-type domain-containing protein n=2 Tax=Guillardia theta TaxID=55529 RepID=L1K1J5_GUITC|nr:hypothetical protein GUITHDRAFT_100489 [Guillardia theta CCMP2712]EKX54243.1 hypothetical protein GUITHDRAFT_100489 [Guillardia theta CCMP2712]|eukprot:XP_005841223.1 hypothetical protein GUITHDRAFT_100489 [Guillardia theta CCMP2712]
MGAQGVCDGAAEALRKSKRGEGVRQVLYSMDLPASAKPQLQAIVFGVLKNEELLLTVARESGLMSQIPSSMLRPDDKLLLVLLYEALLGSRRVRGTAPLVDIVKRNKANLQKTLAEKRKKGQAAAYAEKIRLPRYVRVNVRKTNMESVLQSFQLKGWNVKTVPSEKSSKKQTADAAPAKKNNMVEPPKGTIVMDSIIKNLLAFPAGTSLFADRMFHGGEIILQDRSSCLSAVALDPLPPGAICVDTCAAPGNKTSHVAALLYEAHSQALLEGATGKEAKKGQILAFERDKVRESVLRKQMVKLGCNDVVEVHGQDFSDAARRAIAGDTSSTSSLLREASHFLVDPSCSGSGLVAQYHGSSSGVQTGEEEKEEQSHEHDEQDGNNIASLAAEQVKLVLDAMSLPKAEVVVYSTCSVHQEENEDVVAKVLQATRSFKQVAAIPSWPHRGLATAGPHGPLCVRASHDKDSTNGFFVARFERIRGEVDGKGGAGQGGGEKKRKGEEQRGRDEKKGKKSKNEQKGGNTRTSSKKFKDAVDID